MDEIAVGGSAFEIPAGTVSLNVLGAVPVPRNLYTADGEQVLAGIPTADITIESVTGDPLLEALGEPIVFIGLGRSRFGFPGVLELIDDQVRPVRGLGRHQIELNGIAERLNPGDGVQLLLYGFHPQFFGNGSRDLSSLLLRVSGEVELPLLGPVPSMSAQP